ncbi:MerR family transcriptional regulator [Streptomyces sp. NPDC090022]|uniref:MerR family transcriptional regulator n=1 Tax=Streptomyces sp. NPDC090022 TaxID=3365920 RepID=UPI0037F2178B
MSENDTARQVLIGEAAALTGTTPRTLRHYHDIGLLPEPERGPDDRRRYGYDDIVRILWVRRMAELGMTLDEVRSALAARTHPEELLAELDASLAEQEAQLAGRRAALRRLRLAGGPHGLLSERVLAALGPAAGSLEAAELDSLLVTEHLLGPQIAEREATTHHVLALHPRLRQQQRRLEHELMELADAAVDDPRVERLARDYFVHIQSCEAAERAAGFPEADFLDDDVTFDPDTGRAHSAEMAAYASLPASISPAQARCAALLGELIGEWAADAARP